MNRATRDALIDEARDLRKTRRTFWSDYSDFKKRITDTSLNNREYEQFIDRLVKVLDL